MRFVDDEKTRWGSRHVVAADILRGLGKGFLIACAGIIVGVLIGTSPLAAGRVLTILGAGTVGAACMGVAGVLREHEANTRIAGCDTKSPSTDNPYIAPQIPDSHTPQLATSDVPDRQFVELMKRQGEQSEDVTEEDRAVTQFVEKCEADRSRVAARGRIH